MPRPIVNSLARPNKIVGAAGLAVLVVVLAMGAVLTALSAERKVPICFNVVGILPVFLAIQLVRPSVAAMLAGFWGLCVVTLPGGQARMGASDPAILLLAIAMPALHAWICASVTHRVRFSPLMIAFAWVGVELAFVGLGLERGFIGSFVDQGPIVGWLSSSLGTLFAGLLVAYLAAWLGLAISEADRLMPSVRRPLRAYIELFSNTLFRNEILPTLRFASQPCIPRGPPLALQ